MSAPDAGSGPESALEDFLVERARAGDREALGALYDRFAPRILAFARGMLGSREDAEEVVTDAFIAAFRFARDLRSSRSFGGWMLRVARNQCLDRLRQPRLLTLPLEETSAPVHWPLPPRDELDRLGLRIHLEQALEQLPPDQRAVLLLRDAQQFSVREVSTVLERSEAAVRSLHLRARRGLRKALEELDA